MAEHIRRDHVSAVNESFIERVSYPPLGKNWVSNFMNHHPHFKATYARRIEASRVDQSTEESCKKWLNVVSEILQEYDIPATNVYNMDETGFNVGVAQTGRVVVDIQCKVKYKRQPGRIAE